MEGGKGDSCMEKKCVCEWKLRCMKPNQEEKNKNEHI